VDVAGTSSAVAPPLIDLRWRTGVNGSLAINTPSRAGSLNPDSNYLGLATSAGAANASQSTDPKTVPLESFSAGCPDPDVCPADVNGQCLFFGTSAAAPSAVGVAAVVRQELGGRLPPRLLNLALAKLAVDRGDPGRDNLWGAGVLRVLPV